MIFKLIGLANLFRKPTSNSPVTAALSLGSQVMTVSLTTFAEVDQAEESNGFVFVANPRGDNGWVERRLLNGFARSDVTIVTLVLEAMKAESAFNDDPETTPWFVTADFVLARGLIATGLSNSDARAAGPDAFGPFRVSRDEWKAFLHESGMKAKFSPDGWDSPIEQIWAASYRMKHDAAKLFELNKSATGEDDFIPSYLDLFHAYLLDSPEAALLLRKLSARTLQNGVLDQALANRSIEAALRDVVPEAVFPTLYAVRGEFFGTAAAPATLRNFLIQTEATLRQRMEDGFRLIKESAPELLPPPTMEAPLDGMVGSQAGIGNLAERGGGLLGRLIGGGEGGSGQASYRAFNRGRAGDSKGQSLAFETMTLAEVMKRQKKGAANRIFATGKYQIIPGTLAEAVTKLSLGVNRLYDPETQELLFRQYLVCGKRPPIFKYITGKTSDLFAAQMALAQEFASVGRPDSGRSYYGGIAGNAASIRPSRSADVLRREREGYAAKLKEFGNADKAWLALSSAF